MAVFTGTVNDDVLTGSAADDILNGLDGNDQLNGGEGNDVLDGGAGNDWLSGGDGNDTYLFGVGSGHDTINEYVNSRNYGGNDTVVFNGLAQADVSFAKLRGDDNGDDLLVTIKATGETLTIQRGFSDNDYSYWVENFQFTDGTLSHWDINVLTSSGGAGDDTIWGFIGKDTLTGGAGDDQLNGREGDDVLDGGAGNDLLSGGNGNDTYLFGVGSGHDTINEYWYSYNYGGNDIVVFNGLKKADVSFQRIDDNLLATIVATGDTLTIQHEYNGDTGYKVENFQFTDGTLTGDQVQTVHNGGTGDDVVYGGIYNDSLYGYEGNDILIDNTGGDDLLDGGAGVDIMIGGLGNDTYVVDNAQDRAVEISTLASEIDTLETSVSFILSKNIENMVLTGGNAINGTGNRLDNVLVGNDAANILKGFVGNDVLDGGKGADTLVGGLGNDTFVLGSADKADKVTDFVSGIDHLQIIAGAGGLAIGNADQVIDNAVETTTRGGFSSQAELVLVSADIVGAISGSKAAANIGHATSAYALGDVRLFAVDNGVNSALYLFKSADANAMVSAAELTLIGTVQGAETALADYSFA